MKYTFIATAFLFISNMKLMRQIGLFAILLSFLTSCNGQIKSDNQSPNAAKSDTEKVVGGGCEGCELMYVGMPEEIFSEHISIGWTEGIQKIILTGKVFHLDGKTPAPNCKLPL